MTESTPTYTICESVPPAIQLYNQVCAKREDLMELLEATRHLTERLTALVSVHSVP